MTCLQGETELSTLAFFYSSICEKDMWVGFVIVDYDVVIDLAVAISYTVYY